MTVVAPTEMFFQVSGDVVLETEIPKLCFSLSDEPHSCGWELLRVTLVAENSGPALPSGHAAARLALISEGMTGVGERWC